jgi:type II secretory pathway component PulC
MGLSSRLAALLACLPLLAACGGGASENAGPTTAKVAPPPPAADDAPEAKDHAREPEATPAGTIARARIDDTLSAGPGMFLQHVVLSDEPVMVDGKFHGFRIKELRGEMWKGVDLHPNDVVTRVNGFAIERPEQAVEAFQSLSVASELRVSYDRDGKPRELRYAIVDPLPPPAPAGNGKGKSDGGTAPKPR